MHTLRLILLILIALLVAGCGHSGEVENFSTDLQALAAQISLTIDANPSVAGVQEGHKNLKSKQKSLLEKWNKLKEIQLSPTEKTRLLLAVTDSRTMITDTGTKHIDGRLRDPLFNDAFTLLQRDFESLCDPAAVR